MTLVPVEVAKNIKNVAVLYKFCEQEVNIYQTELTVNRMSNK